MRTDHIEKVTSACGNLARLAQEVANEHRHQIESLERIMRSTESAAGKWTSSEAKPNVRPAPGKEEVSDLRGLQDAFKAVIRAVEGDV